jgi:hypothetical protein
MTKIEKYLRGHPDANPKFVADKFSMSISYVYVLKSKIKKERIADGLIKSSPKKEVKDNVNHPAHYKTGGIETIDFIEAKNLSYNLGNVVKYITRADYKGNKIEDLKKAQWYLNREVSNLEKSK